MTANTLAQPRAAQSSVALAGWSTIVGGALTFALGFPLAPFQAQEPPPAWIPILNAASHVLLIIGLGGLARAGVAGRGALAASGLGLTILGLAVLTAAEIVWLTRGESVALYVGATLLFTPGLILLGVAALRARRWGGWRRFTPLACGLFIPLVFFPSFALPGYATNYALGAWGVCWLLLGFALTAEAR